MKAVVYDGVMKQRDMNDLVTKGYLKKEFHTFKKEIKNEICFELRTEMDTKFGALYENLKDWKDQILQGNDKLMGRFDTFEKENASMNLNYRYVKDDVEDLQTRVTLLEKSS